jgi:hypothetical protein
VLPEIPTAAQATRASVTKPSIETATPMMPVATNRFCTIHEERGSRRNRTRLILDFVQIAALDEGDEFVPFGVRKPNGICVLTDRDALVGDLDLRAFRAERAECESDGFQRGPP